MRICRSIGDRGPDSSYVVSPWRLSIARVGRGSGASDSSCGELSGKCSERGTPSGYTQVCSRSRRARGRGRAPALGEMDSGAISASPPWPLPGMFRSYLTGPFRRARVWLVHGSGRLSSIVVETSYPGRTSSDKSLLQIPKD